jgi:hypothetical protein
MRNNGVHSLAVSCHLLAAGPEIVVVRSCHDPVDRLAAEAGMTTVVSAE